MCGIAGAALKAGRAVPQAALRAMGDALVHRGPDGVATELRGAFGLLHRRLAIVDLETGDQPLRDPAGIELIANAEIYNDLEVRRATSPNEYRTGSDCETALRYFVRDGIGFAKSLRGMFAVAVQDCRDESLTLSRDRFGIKPLYYCDTPDGVWFASEPQALIAAGVVPPVMNASARDTVLAMQFSPGTETIFKGVRRVAPGETLRLRDGIITERQFNAAVPAAPPAVPQATTEHAAIAEFDSVFMESVRVHQRADVPFGMFLSGGIDSTAILVAMSRLNQQPVLAYTAAFPDTAVPDERAAARAVARHCGARHVEVEITAEDFYRHLPAIVAAVDDPVADYAIVPSYLLAQRAKHDVKVVLTGEGGDEMFAGYGRYRSAVRPWPFRRRPWRRGILHNLGVLREQPTNWRAGLDRLESGAARAGRGRLHAAQVTDINGWLPDDLLIKLDRTLMAHGLEGRVPFVDAKVAAFAFDLPQSFKIRDGLGKWLVRRWVSDAVPGYNAFDRKRGFTVPVADWIALRGSCLGPLVARQPGVAEIARPEAVIELFAKGVAIHGQAKWMLLFYALWHNRHMLGRVADGDVFDVLSARS